MDYDVYQVVGPPPCYTEHMSHIEKEHRNHLMPERLRPVDRVKLKKNIHTILFNLWLHKNAENIGADLYFHGGLAAHDKSGE